MSDGTVSIRNDGCAALKRIVKVIYLESKDQKRYVILLSTNMELKGEKVYICQSRLPGRFFLSPNR